MIELLPAQASARSQIWPATLVSLAVVGAWRIVPDPSVPIAAAALLWAGLAVMFRPFLMCLIFIAFSYFRLHEAFPVLDPLHIPRILGICAVTATVFHVFVARSILPKWSLELKLFLI